jgi:O-antigen/teichoic acid export membrane protein
MVTNQYATILGKQHLVFRAQIVTVITLAAAIYPLVGWLGLLGVTIANNVGNLANALTFVFGLWSVRTASMRTTVRWLIASTFLTVLAMLPVYAMRDMRFGWLSAIPAVAIFVVGAIVFRMLGMEDFRRLLRALKRRRLAPEAAGG